ncbi:hypothetical protein BC936DRAFT_145030 [Jimgerdemannia flammicorona]|uniref:Uncharacterized protein n=1 Tax=Jimgerdemannia flammicorona TaxID=994334 RepID=A0A433DM14_9FUNG|nr:hypothetical protein BC936DRAFT_145030 [Jimgerdemannia flammicorona]
MNAMTTGPHQSSQEHRDRRTSSILTRRPSLADPRSSILTRRRSSLARRSSLVDPHSSILARRFSLVDPHSSILARRFSLVDPRSSILTHRSSLADPHMNVINVGPHQSSRERHDRRTSLIRAPIHQTSSILAQMHTNS